MKKSKIGARPQLRLMYSGWELCSLARQLRKQKTTQLRLEPTKHFARELTFRARRPAFNKQGWVGSDSTLTYEDEYSVVRQLKQHLGRRGIGIERVLIIDHQFARSFSGYYDTFTVVMRVS